MTEPGPVPEKLDFSTIGEVLYRFGTEQREQLTHIRTRGFWTWALLKEPLFHLILGNEIRKSNPGTQSSPAPPSGGHRFCMLVEALLLPLRLWMLAIRYRYRNPVVVLSNHADRIMADDQGKRLNPMFDILMKEDIASRKMIMLENAISGKKQQTAIVPDLYVGATGLFARAIAKGLRQAGAEKSTANEVCRIFNSWCQARGLAIQLDAGYIQVLLCLFRANFTIYRMIWYLLRPSLILTSERGATGECTAALRRGVPVLDFQHGLMDRYFTDYMFPEWMQSDRVSAGAPDGIVLFGKIQGEFLEKAGFWEPSRLLAAGSYRVDIRRNPGTSVPGKVILFANQWHVFDHASALISSWLESGWLATHGWKLRIKLHPLDPPHVQAFFEQLSLRYSETCQLFGKDSDIYSIIPESRVLLGYDSTVLVEAISLGKPVISIDPGVIAGGLHTYVPFTSRLSCIRMVKDFRGIQEALAELEDPQSASSKAWMDLVRSEGPAIFMPGYLENIRQIIANWIKRH